MKPSNATMVIFIEGGIHEPVARSTAFPVRVASTSSASLSCVNVSPPRGRRRSAALPICQALPETRPTPPTILWRGDADTVEPGAIRREGAAVMGGEDHGWRTTQTRNAGGYNQRYPPACR